MSVNILYRLQRSKFPNRKQTFIFYYQTGLVSAIFSRIQQLQLIPPCRLLYQSMVTSQSFHTILIPKNYFRSVLLQQSSACNLSKAVPTNVGIVKTSVSPIELSSFKQKQKGICFLGRKNSSRLLSSEKDSAMEDGMLHELFSFLDSLKDYEKEHMPAGAGTDTEEGFDLQRMKRLMQLLGDPLAHYPVIHIAGTKGKGSTSAFVSSILRAEGYSVGVYTSPHLHTIRERIVIGRNAEIISAEALQNLFSCTRASIENALRTENLSLTYFEVLTALAFKYFAIQHVDIAVIEAGLGGARDATNVISSDSLATSVITTIGAEHKKALGGSLESIALAKSGIIKEGRPVVLGGPFVSHIKEILHKKAVSMNAPIISSCDPSIHSTITGLNWTKGIPHQLVDISIKLDENEPNLNIELLGVKLGLLGVHQLQNAVTAVCTALCLRKQGWKISSRSIIDGLENTSLPGRFQILTPAEAKKLDLDGTSIVLDGAHTEASAKALADTIMMLYPENPLAFVISMADDKDHSAFAQQLLSVTMLRAAIFSQVKVAGSHTRTMPASSLMEIWTQNAQGLMQVIDWNKMQNVSFNGGISHSMYSTHSTLLVAEEPTCIKSALRKARRLLECVSPQENGIICVTGSLHVVSAVVKCLRD